MQQEYFVHLDTFEGPLDLLLFLIHKNEVDIYDIPIAFILEEYLHYLGQWEDLNIAIAGEFFEMAATLMNVKSRLLLPQNEFVEDSAEDPRTELVQHLLEYQRFKKVTGQLREQENWQSTCFPVKTYFHAEQTLPEYHIPPNEGDLFQLAEQFFRLIRQEKVVEKIHEVEAEPISLEEKIELLLDLLWEYSKICLTDLYEAEETNFAKVTLFIASLEIAKLQQGRIFQRENFSEIWLYKRQAE